MTSSMGFAVGRDYPGGGMAEEGLETTFSATGDIGVQYGPLRLAVAARFNKNPEDITGQDVAQYEMELEAQA